MTNMERAVLMALCLTFASKGRAQDITTKCYDNARTCSTASETLLTPAAVRQHGMTLQTTVPVIGDARGMEAQQLTWSGVMVLPSMANIIRGVRPEDGVGLWQTAQLCVPVNSTPQNDMWRVSDHFGMLSTGVIDKDTGKLYQVAHCSKDGSGSQVSMQQRMFVLDVRTGAVLAQTVLDGVSNGLRYADAPRKQRGALALWKRNGVKMVLIEAGSFNENDRSAGWLLAFDTFDNTVKAALAPHAGLWQTGLGPVVDDATGLIYIGAGNGPYNHMDSYGESAMQIQFTPPMTATPGSYFIKDTRTGERANFLPASFTVPHAWSPFSDSSRTCSNPQLTQSPKVEAVIAGQSAPSSVPGANMPMKADCSAAWGDQDAWLTGTLLTKFHMYLGAGKDGVGFAIDTQHFPDTQPADFADPKKNCAKVKMYEFGWDLGVDPCPANMAALNRFPNGKTRHQHSPIVSFEQDGKTYVLFFGENSPLQVWRVNADGTFTFIARGAEIASFAARGMHGGMPGGFGTVSSNNGKDAIAWYSVPDDDANRTITSGRMFAYDLRNLAALEGTGRMIPTIWRSSQYIYNKFSTPVVRQGRVYLANYSGGVMVWSVGR